jgi:hypothetical protein
VSGGPEFGRQVRAALRLPADTPWALVLAAIDVDKARMCTDMGLPASTPPAQVRAAAQVRAEALALVEGRGPSKDQAAYETLFGPVDRVRAATAAYRNGTSNVNPGWVR